MPSLLKLANWFWSKSFWNFVNVFSLFSNYLPLEQGVAIHLNKFESPLLKNALCQVWLNWPVWFWRRLLNFFNVYLLFRNYLPLEKGVVLHLINLNSLPPVMICAKFGWNCPNGSWEDFKINFKYIYK